VVMASRLGELSRPKNPELPQPLNEFYLNHAKLLCSSYRHWMGCDLVEARDSAEELLRDLFYGNFALLSHGTGNDPIFNFGNQVALNLFEFSWEELTNLPSRKSAEAVNREQRAKLLDQVTAKGFISDYSGVRISATGKRFFVENAVVWNLLDDSGLYRGQAACFESWKYVTDK